MTKRSFLCLAAVPVFWALSWALFVPLLLGMLPWRSWGWGFNETVGFFFLLGGAGTWLLTLAGTFFAWTALRSVPRADGAAVAFALNLVIFLLSLGLVILGGASLSNRHPQIGDGVLAALAVLTVAGWAAMYFWHRRKR
jgi:hypothetical protein